MTASARPGADLAARLEDPDLFSAGEGPDGPHELFARLRAEAPVAWNEERGYWALTKHADVCAVETDHQTFCARSGILVDEIGVEYPSPPTMMHTDPPEHSRYRRLVQPGFKPSVVRTLEVFVRSRSKTLVDRIEGARPIDIVHTLAVPLPLQVITQMLGVPDEEWERCYEWSEAVIPGATDWPEERRQELLAEMSTYLLDATVSRRAEPREDILGQLAAASLDGDQLSDAELMMFLIQLLVAGNETTRNLISAGLVALAQRPDQWELLRAQSSLVPRAVEELLRFTTPVISFMRTATRDAEMRGVQIAEGEPVLMVFASANRDEEVFGPDARRLDVARDPNPHLAFGFGNHFCLGAALARLEGRIVLEELLGRYAKLELAGPVERTGSTVIAGVRRAEMVFTAG